MRHCYTSFAIIIMVSFLAGPASADEDITKKLWGKIFVADRPLSPPPDEDTFVEYLESNDMEVITENSPAGWEIHFLAFFKPMDAQDCEVVFYMVEDEKGKKISKQFVNNFTHQISDPKQTSLLSTLILENTIFEPGKYEMLVTRVVKKKEKIYSSKTIVLKPR